VAAGIGWVVLNCDVDDLEQLRRSAKAPVFSVTRDHVSIGRIQGQQFGAFLPEGGTVLYIQGPPASVAAQQRTDGMQATKPENVQLQLLRSQWTEPSAREAVRSWLRLAAQSRDVDLVGCQYDGIAMGARYAFEAHTSGAQRERWLGLPFTGVDGLPDEGQAAVNKGLLAATVVAPITTGTAIKMLTAAINTGAELPGRLIIESTSYPSIDTIKARSRWERTARAGTPGES
jgi:ribose transport system substrate-binding protein